MEKELFSDLDGLIRYKNIYRQLKSLLVEKVLRTLPKAYNPKVSSLEDRENLEEITMDEL